MEQIRRNHKKIEQIQDEKLVLAKKAVDLVGFLLGFSRSNQLILVFVLLPVYCCIICLGFDMHLPIFSSCAIYYIVSLFLYLLSHQAKSRLHHPFATIKFQESFLYIFLSLLLLHRNLLQSILIFSLCSCFSYYIFSVFGYILSNSIIGRKTYEPTRR